MCISDPVVDTPTGSCLSFQPGMSARQRQILRVALRLFGAREYAAVSLRDIAGEAGVSLTLIDHHFGAKHALFAAVVRTWCPVFEQATLEIRHGLAQGRLSTPAELLALMLRPVERLLADPDGQDVLRLWARHRRGTELAICGPMGLALDPFKQAIDRTLERLYPGRTEQDRSWATAFAFAALLEFAVADLHDGERTAELDAESPARKLLSRHIEGGWRAGLGAGIA
jgi:AcrR family transcriptional regulator